MNEHPLHRTISRIATERSKLTPQQDLEIYPSGAVNVIESYGSLAVVPIINGGSEFLTIDAGHSKKARRLSHFLVNESEDLLGFQLDEDGCVGVLQTHFHEDHSNGLNAIGRSVPTFTSKIGTQVARGERPSAGPLPRTIDKTLRYLGYPSRASVENLETYEIEDGWQLQIGELLVGAIFTPGHAKEAISYTIRRGDETEATDLFVGDAFDFDKLGNVKMPPKLVSDNLLEAQASILKLAKHFTKLVSEDEIVLGRVKSSHGGSGSYDALFNYRPTQIHPLEDQKIPFKRFAV